MDATLEPPEPPKKRRQTLIYPPSKDSVRTPKPFSRSAAKRDSVLALGSIEHLQHYFTKAGIQAKQKYVARPSSQISDN